MRNTYLSRKLKEPLAISPEEPVLVLLEFQA